MYFSNSFTIHQDNTKEIRTVTVVWKSDLNFHRFLRFYFSVSSVVLVSIEKLYQILVRVCYHMSKHLEVLGVWKCDETLSLVFDILHGVRP